jgi:hypothetical protein
MGLGLTRTIRIRISKNHGPTIIEIMKDGMLECWNVGMLGIKAEVKHYNCEKLLQTHHFYPVKLFSISPGLLLHYSTIPIGAKPLTCI